jgi:hypothetical protein
MSAAAGGSALDEQLRGRAFVAEDFRAGLFSRRLEFEELQKERRGIPACPD